VKGGFKREKRKEGSTEKENGVRRKEREKGGNPRAAIGRGARNGVT
jgi:hypothetical protein